MKKLIILLFILMLSVALFSCAKQGDTSEVVPSNVKVASISLNENSFKNEYLVGETIDFSSASITVYYDNSTSKQVAVNLEMTRDFDTIKEGIYRGYIAYAEKETSFLYSVVTARLIGKKVTDSENNNRIGIEISIEGAKNLAGGAVGMLIKINNATDNLDFLSQNAVESKKEGFIENYPYLDNDKGVLNFIFEDPTQKIKITEDTALFTVWFIKNGNPIGLNNCVFISASISNGVTEYSLKTIKIDEFVEA